MKKSIKFFCLATLSVLVSSAVLPNLGGTQASANSLLLGQGQLSGLWHETVKQVTMLVALPQYQLLDEEEQEAAEEAPVVSTSDVLELLKMAL